MPTLLKQKKALSDPEVQLQILADAESLGIRPFAKNLAASNLFPLKPTKIDTLQINVGKICNQTCKHCHVDARPDRREVMSKETLQQCLDVIEDANIQLVDITGGAPELNPNFRWFIEEVSALGCQIIVRCNLTIIVSNGKFHDLPEFYRKYQVNVVSSLPHFTSHRTDAQRGDGVFKKSIEALRLLNNAGYGTEPNLKLDLVYNPTGAILPGDQALLEVEFKKKLNDRYGIVFNNLFTITNLPVSRFLDYLILSENYDDYMQELANAYNPSAAQGVMCRNMISVGWDGYLYDCDFNQMLDLKIDTEKTHISQFDMDVSAKRSIVVNNHCYGCTAGAGSSCGGTIA